MEQLTNSEIFALTLVIGTYVTALALYRKVHFCLLHPLLTTIFVIIAILEILGIPYESFQRNTHLIHFLLGPSVVALGYVLYEQIQYLKGNVVSILTSVFVGAIVGIVSVIVIGKVMGADQALIASLQPKSVTTPIAMGISEKTGGIPSLTIGARGLLAWSRNSRRHPDRTDRRGYQRTCHRSDGRDDRSLDSRYPIDLQLFFYIKIDEPFATLTGIYYFCPRKTKRIIL